MLLFGIIWICLLEKNLCFVNSDTTAPQFCADTSDDCSKIDCSWSEAKKFCPKKCGGCRICEDTKTDCTFLKENNLCTSHHFLQIAAESCPESCNFCTPCHDTQYVCAGLKRYCNSQTNVAVACEKTCNRCKPYNMTETIEKFGGNQIQTTIASTTAASTTIASTTAASTSFTTASGTTATAPQYCADTSEGCAIIDCSWLEAKIYCPKKCGVCRICEDTKSDCTFLKENNLCTSHHFLQIAAESCPESCNFCTPCHDTPDMEVCAGLQRYCNSQTTVAVACEKTCNRCKPYNMTEIIEKFGGNQIQTTIASTTAASTTASSTAFTTASGTTATVPQFCADTSEGCAIIDCSWLEAKKYCPKKCGVCRICEDTKTNCTFLKENNLCTSAQFLQIAAENCPGSCNFCTPCHDTLGMDVCAGLKSYCNERTSVADACRKTCNRCKPYNMTETIEKFGGNQIQTTIASTTASSTTIASTTASSAAFTTTSGTTATAMVTNAAGSCSDNEVPGFSCAEWKGLGICSSTSGSESIIAKERCQKTCGFCS